MAATALGGIGPAAAKNEGAVSALIVALKDAERNVRWGAAYALGRIGPDAKDAVPALTEVLKDEDQNVRNSAEEALKRIKAEK